MGLGAPLYLESHPRTPLGVPRRTPKSVPGGKTGQDLSLGCGEMRPSPGTPAEPPSSGTHPGLHCPTPACVRGGPHTPWAGKRGSSTRGGFGAPRCWTEARRQPPGTALGSRRLLGTHCQGMTRPIGANWGVCATWPHGKSQGGISENLDLPAPTPVGLGVQPAVAQQDSLEPRCFSQ